MGQGQATGHLITLFYCQLRNQAATEVTAKQQHLLFYQPYLCLPPALSLALSLSLSGKRLMTLIKFIIAAAGAAAAQQ